MVKRYFLQKKISKGAFQVALEIPPAVKILVKTEVMESL